LISTGNQNIENALRKMNSQDAKRAAQSSISNLQALDLKVIIQKLDYEIGSYDVLPCGQAMTLCNMAFIELSNRFEDILSTSFEESPKGDKTRVF
jgi:galactitol-specific phosphotransferase system IIB component